jgi:hypothetical protein
MTLFTTTLAKIEADNRKLELLSPIYYLSEQEDVIRKVYFGDHNRIIPGLSKFTSDNLRASELLQKQALLRQTIPRGTRQGKSQNVSNVTKLYQSPLGYNCYSYVKSQGFPSLGYHFDTAKDVKEISLVDSGRFAITYESKIQHFVMVIGETDTDIIVRDGNYEKGWVTERHIAKNSGIIRGYIK